MGIQVMNKRGMEIKSALFAIIIVGVVIVAVGVIVSSWNQHYGSGLTYDLSEYNKISDVSSDAESQQGKVTPNDPDPGTGIEDKTYRGVYSIIANVYAPFRVAFGDNGMIDSITERFGLPDYIRQALVTMIIIAITMAIIAIIFRLPRSTV